MKNYLVIIIFLCASIFLMPAQANAQENPIGSISIAMRAGDAGAISRYLDNVVDITINSNQSTYSRTQAEMILKDFFNKNTPKAFEVERSGNAQSSGVFNIGYLTTGNGRYRVYIFLKEKENRSLIQEIRFEK